MSDDATDESEPEDDDSVAVITADDLSLDARQWLRAIVPVLQLRSGEPDPSPRVQLALDDVLIAAAERAIRILRSDDEEL